MERRKNYQSLGLFIQGAELRASTNSRVYKRDLTSPGVPDDWFSIVENPQADFQEPGFDEAGNMKEGYSVQFSVGEPVLFAEDEDRIKPEEFAAVMRTLARKETFR